MPAEPIEVPSGNVPVTTKAALVEPSTMRAVWLNGPAAESAGVPAGAVEGGMPVESVVPMAAPLGLASVLEEVSASGETRHLTADLVSTYRGSMSFVISVHRLPDGMLLVLVENTWRAKGERAQGGAGARHGSRRHR